MSPECEICEGRRVIRLPRYRPLVAGPIEAHSPIDVEINVSEYPCPECSTGKNMPYERLAIVKRLIEAPQRLMNDERLMDSARMSAAQQLVASMVKRGFFRFEQSEPDHNGTFKLRATVGIVAPSVVAKFEERVAERQFEVAAGLIETVSEEISNWGSYYHGRQGGSVRKEQAIEWLQEGLRKLKAKFAHA